MSVVVGTEWREADLSRLLLAYHLRTEAEKGVPVPGVDGLPDRYRDEVLDPGRVFAGGTVFVATVVGRAVGCVVAQAPDGDAVEVKRLWVDPGGRGRGVATALMDAVLGHAASAGARWVRLSVWDWRADAIALYERLGFARVASWDRRPRLVCLSRPVGSDNH
jgi:putative acetyltransferase